MTIPRFYCPDLVIGRRRVALPAAAAHHAARVLRLKAGDPVTLFDGRGGEWEASIARIDPRGVEVEAGTPRPSAAEPPLRVTLAQGLCAQDKMDWVVQKAVELGVTAIQPVAAERSVIRLSAERAERRQRHWQAVVVAACEQSGRNVIPEVAPVRTLAQWLDVLDAAPDRGGLRLTLSPHAGVPMAALGNGLAAASLLVGPEGGLSEREVAMAAAAGFRAARLGPRVLRTETAALAALAAMQTLWGDWR
ncbi:MAG TPA: 16S rRNA (uracil(1498)-N(3))-methyltransferase [Pelomicrobium sp.]|nr:16S rRNA (uracil(1498)-N(3))-methyltransferase [Pelomicrobium sp.]